MRKLNTFILILMLSFLICGCNKIEDYSEFVIEDNVLKEYIGPAKEVVIPNEVTEVEASVFKNNPYIETVIFPDNIETLEKSMFNNCFSLKKVVLPKNLKTIPDYCFYHCYSLTDVTINDNVEIIGSNAFNDCRDLKNIKIPNSVKEIKEAAFLGCRSIVNIKLPNSITRINTLAFKGCSNLEQIELPKTSYSLAVDVFVDCINLKSIDLSHCETITPTIFNGMTNLEEIIIKNHERYVIYDDVIYDNLNKILVYYPATKPDTEYTVIDGTLVIGTNAFRNAVNLEYVNIVTEVTDSQRNSVYIYDYAFKGCTNLIQVNSPYSISNVGKESFSDCPNLEKVFVTDSLSVTGKLGVFKNSPNAKFVSENSTWRPN